MSQCQLSVISLCKYGLMDIYFLLWVITQYYFILLLKVVIALASRSYFSWLLFWLWHTPINFFLSTSLLFGIVKYSRFILYISTPVLDLFL
jgi:hypothetical protein